LVCISWHLSPSQRHTSYFRPIGLAACVTLLSLLGNSSVNTLPRQRIHVTIENCWTRHFLCGPCCMKGK
jgi:hypothetical protein